MTDPVHTGATGNYRIGWWCVGVVATVLILGALALKFEISSADALKAALTDLGAWGVVASIALMVAHSFVPFPAELVACANGAVYGTVWGTVITWIGAMLGAFLAFGFSRRYGQPLVSRFVSKRHHERLMLWSRREGWHVFLVCRFIPVIAFNLINYAAGLTQVSWWTFTWTTGIGILPMTVLMVVLGDNLGEFSWPGWAAVMSVGIVLWWLIRKVRRGTASMGVGPAGQMDSVSGSYR